MKLRIKKSELRECIENAVIMALNEAQQKRVVKEGYYDDDDDEFADVLAKNGYGRKVNGKWQGESDKKMAENYYDNLKAVVGYVRDYLVEKTGDERYRYLPFVCGTFSKESRDRSEVIVSALYKLEAEDENFHVVDISDGSLLSDRLHFDAKGAERLGMRMFKKLTKIKAVSTRNKEVINLLRNSQ